jgi:hypothetical protein
MILISRIHLTFLIFFSLAVVCKSQDRSTVVGFQCSNGENNQPRPEIRLHVGDITRRALVLPQPQCPPVGGNSRFYGRVRAEVVIRVDTGEVVWARIIEGHPFLREAVKRVVCQVRFRHTNDVNGYVSGIITYNFARCRRVQLKPSHKT